MKDKVTETIDRLRGFDGRKLQREMTAGLPEWHHRRKEAAHNRRLYATTTCVMLLVVAGSFRLAPTLNYRLSNDGTCYEEVVRINNNMLRR